jgi:hypothetical protein
MGPCGGGDKLQESLAVGRLQLENRWACPRCSQLLMMVCCSVGFNCCCLQTLRLHELRLSRI